ncbi:Uncharacterized protein dnl_16300 [Desulfonema limicola]|uniref:Uncharacterized protein n=1 Tax=Desulfonema limicola TaxID=45656 RepID=A0A975GFL6_9BACT|nr:Uncharacterized protein dnl_16300 [Desulfonema limicola]
MPSRASLSSRLHTADTSGVSACLSRKLSAIKTVPGYTRLWLLDS